MRRNPASILLAACVLASASASVCAQTEDQKQAITAHLAGRLLPADAAPIDGAVLIEQGGLPYEAALAALTIVPARQIGHDDRVGSLTVGKDADFLVTAGDPLDPRVPPSMVYIEGQLIHRSGDVR